MLMFFYETYNVEGLLVTRSKDASNVLLFVFNCLSAAVKNRNSKLPSKENQEVRKLYCLMALL